MLILASNTDLLQIVCNAAGAIDAHVSWMDNVSGAVVPGRTNTGNIAVTSVTTICGAPAVGTFRNIKTVHIRNRGSVDNAVTLIHTDGLTAVELYKATAPAGGGIQYIDEVGFDTFAPSGEIITPQPPGSGSGAWELIESKPVSAPVPTLNFTKGFDQTYDQFMFRLWNIQCIKPNQLWMRISTDGGATWIATTNAYANLVMQMTQSNTGNAPVEGYSLNNKMQVLGQTADESSRLGNFSRIEFSRPWDPLIRHGMLTDGWYVHDTAGLARFTSVSEYLGNPFHLTSFNGVQFIPGTTDSIKSGTINFYGIKR